MKNIFTKAVNLLETKIYSTAEKPVEKLKLSFKDRYVNLGMVLGNLWLSPLVSFLEHLVETAGLDATKQPISKIDELKRDLSEYWGGPYADKFERYKAFYTGPFAKAKSKPYDIAAELKEEAALEESIAITSGIRKPSIKAPSKRELKIKHTPSKNKRTKKAIK
jgi:hypothetical protein